MAGFTENGRRQKIMKILFYDAKKYDELSFNASLANYPELQLDYLEADVSRHTAKLAAGYDAICAFVSSDLSAPVIDRLAEGGVKLILLRCAGFNNVDLEAAKKNGITVLRVPGYSPEAVAEHAMALALAVNRKIHKAYIKVRENNFALTGLTGMNFYQKTAGIVGTGKIGAAMCRICHGFGMKVIAYDVYQNPSLDFVTYVDMDTLFAESDLISLHCPLTKENHHLINIESIEKIKKRPILINTSRGGLIKTDDLIQGIRDLRFFGVGLDVYEEEAGNVFENREDEILDHSVVARLLSFPNVIVTSHQAFLTEEALKAISCITMENALSFVKGTVDPANQVC